MEYKFSGAFDHGLPFDHVSPKRDISDDELVEASAVSIWLEALKEGL